MIAMTNKGLRRLTFSLYVMMVIGFCVLIIGVGRDEVRRARGYAEREKGYIGALLDCERRLDSVKLAFMRRMAFERTVSPPPSVEMETDTSTLEREALGLVAAVRRLRRREERRMNAALFSASGLLDESRRLCSMVAALRADGRRPGYEARSLIRGDERALVEILSSLDEIVRGLLRVELNHAEMWQRRSFFYFQRLQHVLIVFFVLTILFSVAASSLFGYFLRRSLRSLRAGSHEISAGNLDFRFTEPSDDEIGEVMRDYNFMVERLKGQRAALRQANVELTSKAEELIEAHQHKDRFLANMSHELRTPLNSVIGFAELLEKRAETVTPDKNRRYAGRILHASEHLLALITDLLKISKIDAGVLAPVFNDFDLASCAREVVEMLGPAAERKGLELALTAPESLPVRADKRLLRQVMINLLDNAIKFTNEGGVSLALTVEGNQCRMEVRDTGIGIAEADQSRIFKDFHRVETGLTSNYEGVGLGLTLSKRLVELHEGRIMVSSEPNEGTVFTVLLPNNVQDR